MSCVWAHFGPNALLAPSHREHTCCIQAVQYSCVQFIQSYRHHGAKLLSRFKGAPPQTPEVLLTVSKLWIENKNQYKGNTLDLLSSSRQHCGAGRS